MIAPAANTVNLKDRITTAQWVLERQLAWIAAAEVKVGFTVAIDTALLGGLAAAFSTAEPTARTAWAYLWILIAAGAAVIAIFCAAMTVLPRTSGPTRSLLFFAPVAALECLTYREQFKGATDEALLDDWTTQIHRNSQIACDKYTWVRKAMLWSFFGSMPWLAAVGMLVKT